MAMSANSMATRINTYLDAITHAPTDGHDNVNSTHREAMLEAFCQGIIDEIIAGAKVKITLTGAKCGLNYTPDGIIEE